MTMSTSGSPNWLNARLAWLLGKGTWASCGIIAIGMIVTAFGFSAQVGASIVSAGIVLMIALPTLCVAMMAAYFLSRRELDFAFIAALVVIIIVASTLLGVGAL